MSGYNVVLVIFDTLRKDAVGAYGMVPGWSENFGPIATPRIDEFASEAVCFTRAYPESLPTLPARRAIYTAQRTYPFHNGRFRLKGDFIPAAGWGPIPEEQHTLAEILSEAGFRTGLVSDLYHQFKPSKNFWRGFHQWSFIRGQEADPSRSGPEPTAEELEYWVPAEIRELRQRSRQAFGPQIPGVGTDWFSSRIVLNMRDRVREEDWFNARVMAEAARWLQENADSRTIGQRVFLTVECFDPHEPWFVPRHYRAQYDPSDGREQVISPYAEVPGLSNDLVLRTRANYAGLVTMVDRWFGYLLDSLRQGGWLDDTVVIVTSDHGHSIRERGYIGKRGYPSEPEVLEVPLFVRHPEGLGAGTTCDAWVQHHDLGATVLDAAGVEPPEAIDGLSFWEVAFAGRPSHRKHVVIGWGPAMTVIDGKWWLNVKVDGKGALLYDYLSDGTDPMLSNVAEAYPEVVSALFSAGVAEAKEGFPGFLLEEAALALDVSGCSPLAALRDDVT